ncbi:MAG: hypothetical protein ACT4OX_08700 [Actinomycetota bacterium]
MRRWARAVIAVVVAVGGAGGDSGDGAPARARARACPMLEALDDIAQTVEDADVADPDEFDETMDTAVERFRAVIEDLRAAVPESVASDLDAYEAAVVQFDFDEARAARASLDQFAVAECVPTTTIVSVAP